MNLRISLSKCGLNSAMCQRKRHRGRKGLWPRGWPLAPDRWDARQILFRGTVGGLGCVLSVSCFGIFLPLAAQCNENEGFLRRGFREASLQSGPHTEMTGSTCCVSMCQLPGARPCPGQSPWLLKTTSGYQKAFGDLGSPAFAHPRLCF